jgi:hypothetical protein
MADPIRAVFALLLAAAIGSFPCAGLGAILGGRRGAIIGAIVGAILGAAISLVLAFLIVRAIAPIG